jgi:hypothetical protein
MDVGFEVLTLLLKVVYYLVGCDDMVQSTASVTRLRLFFRGLLPDYNMSHPRR